MNKQASVTIATAATNAQNVAIEWNAELPKKAVIEALEYAHQNSFLMTDKPWNLAPNTARELERVLGCQPCGGWNRLLGLAAGIGWFEAKQDMFVPTVSPETIQALSAQDVQIRLMESFTQQLCPPQTMAGALVALHMHPMWGLRVAHEVRSRGKNTAQIADESMFPRPALAMAEALVFDLIQEFLNTLSQCDSSVAYSTRSLEQLFTYDAKEASAALKAASAEHGSSCLPVILESDFDALSAFLFDDVVGTVLVPANLAKQLENGLFAIDAETIRKVKVGPS